MNSDELKSVLDRHLAWIKNEPDGERANLCDADLFDANLRGANLRGAKNIPDYVFAIASIVPAGNIILEAENYR